MWCVLWEVWKSTWRIQEREYYSYWRVIRAGFTQGLGRTRTLKAGDGLYEWGWGEQYIKEDEIPEIKGQKSLGLFRSNERGECKEEGGTSWRRRREPDAVGAMARHCRILMEGGGGEQWSMQIWMRSMRNVSFPNLHRFFLAGFTPQILYFHSFWNDSICKAYHTRNLFTHFYVYSRTDYVLFFFSW